MKITHLKRISALSQFWLILLPVAACAMGGCSPVEIAAPAEVQPIGGVRVAFDSFVNINYGKNRSLHGWQTSRTAIGKTLKLWYKDVQIRQTVTDGTPSNLRTFLLALPGPDTCDISVVYLGSIQSPDVTWEFVDGASANWRDFLTTAPPPPHPCRIVIVDACYAASVRTIPGWSERFGTITLLASGSTEETYQFKPSALLPINVQKRYPLAWNWGQTHLSSDWSNNISFLGLIWINSAAISPPPADLAHWMEFFDVCRQHAVLFQQTISHRWGSTVQTF
jgi:hypothetical protein